MRTPIGVIVVLIAMFLGSGQSAPGQQANRELESGQVRFRFYGTPWRSVIEWLAESGEYALHVNDLPLGSFTYSDERPYTLDEAINRINMFLIPQRYTLVRSEKLLSVIGLDDETSVRQLDSIARTVSVEELNGFADHEIVKCFFPLGSIAPDHAVEELNGLMLIREPSVLPNTNQLLVIDTAGKMRTVAKVLRSLARPDISSGPVKRFALGDLDPEKTLLQVRPHVGLDPLAMTGADVRLSIDKERHQLLASGSTENLQAIASVIALLQETDAPEVSGDEMIFRPHNLQDAEMQTVVNVLQTLLAEEDVQLAPDVRSNQLAIRANEKVHELVDQTIEELSGSHNAVEFKVIEVNTVDARYAAVVLNDMFASQHDPSESEEAPPETPRIDADSVSGRLFVRARKSQLEEIELALQQFDQASGKGTVRLRLLPYHGEKARTLLDSAQRFWPFDDRIEVLPSLPGSEDTESLEREIKSNPPPKLKPQRDRPSSEVTLTRKHIPLRNGANETDSSQVDRESHSESIVRNPNEQTPQDGSANKILVQQTSGGLLVYSDVDEAIQRFEEHLGLISGSTPGMDRRMAVFYLKHAKIDDANALLRQLLADESLTEIGNPARLARLSVHPTVIDAAGGLNNAWGYDTATVIPDKRLNRLFVYGTQQELNAIEDHLQVIDRENSIAALKTRGTPRIIIFDHARAEDVASVIRDAYSGRIASTAKERSAAAASKNRNQRAQSDGVQRESNSESSAGPTTKESADGDEDKMTLAVDAQSNAMIVTAPSQLADEVEAIARGIDKESRQTVQVIPLGGMQTMRIQESLKNLFGDRIQMGESKVRPTNRSQN